MEAGVIITTIDGVSRVIGLDTSFVGELLILTVVRALSLNLEFLITGLTVLGNDRLVEQGDIAERSFAELLIEVGFYFVGRIIDPIAQFLDE